MRVIVFANGEMEKKSDAGELAVSADLIIAADGGANHCSRLGIIPDILIGDLDSIEQNLLESYTKNKVAIHRHPTRKNNTDLELALEHVLRCNATSLHIFGALGGRWDMSLANIFMLTDTRFEKIKITLSSHDCFMQILYPGKNMVQGETGQRISLLPVKEDVLDVCLEGFEYPLSRYNIYFGSSIGVSNILTKNYGSIKHRAGVLLCIFQNGN